MIAAALTALAVAVPAPAARDLTLVRRAKHHGAHYSLRIIREARRAGIPISLGFALIEQESGFKNVFGHDPTIFVGAGKVTRRKYRLYKAARGQTRMQGVGPAQLTWYSFQDDADRIGGCWRPKYNIRIAFGRVAELRRRWGTHDGLAHYNGTGPQAQNYAREVLARQKHWHTHLT